MESTFIQHRACRQHLRLAGFRSAAVILVFLVAGVMRALAQDTNVLELSSTTNIVSAPEAVAAPEISTSPRFGGTGGQLAAPPQMTNALPASPFEWGPVVVRPHVLYTLSYAHGLQAAPGVQVDTLINEIDPGILLQLGNHWTLDYTPILRYYSSSSFRDTWDNHVILAGATTYKDWTFGLSQSYTSSSEPLVETAGQLDTETYLTTFDATYRMSSATSLELNAYQTFQFIEQTGPAQQLSDWRSWSTLDWFNYELSPGFDAAVGAGFQYDSLAVGPDMTAERFEARIRRRAGSKLNFVLSGGVENRQFLSSGQSDLLTPIFSLGAQYQLFEPTALFLNASRAVSPAYFAAQINENTLISGGINQRLFRRLLLNVTGSYGKAKYLNTASGPNSSIATDYDTTSFNVSLTTALFTRASASVFYQLTYYSSTSAIYDYNTSQVGLSLGYRF